MKSILTLWKHTADANSSETRLSNAIKNIEIISLQGSFQRCPTDFDALLITIIRFYFTAVMGRAWIWNSPAVGENNHITFQ